MSLFCEFGLGLLTKNCTHCFVGVVYWCPIGSEYTGITNQMCRFLCFGKSNSSQGLFVMRLDAGTTNSFCLDDGVAFVKFYSCEAVIIDESVYQQKIQ